MLIWRVPTDVWVLPIGAAGVLAAILYMPLRVRPRRAALDEIRARLELIDPQCPQCGYALRYLQQWRCPECGRRVVLPSAEQVRLVLAGEKITVAKGSIESELGWIVGLLMVLAAVVAGRLLGPLAFWCAAAAPPMLFLLFMGLARYRHARRIPPVAVCDKCGAATSVHLNRCEHCPARLLAEHVYVKPGLRGPDPRLYNSAAQLIGGACVTLMLVVIGLADLDRGTVVDILDLVLVPVEIVLLIVALHQLLRDRRLVSPARLERLDKSTRALCHHCLASLNGHPANGTCPACGEDYSGIELVGGLRRRSQRLETKAPAT
jgi:predicted amidophosphoribosyltransferase